MDSCRAEPGSSLLRRLIRQDEVIIASGVFNPISAKIACRAGFQVLYFSGAALSNSMGLPDLGVVTLSELSTAVHQIAVTVQIPLIVDAETGFGELANVQRTVLEIERAGAAAMHLEDQVMPKKCGHAAGKHLVSIKEMMQKIVAAREAQAGDLLLIARTDARAVEGMEGAIRRAKAYLKAGAEVIFPEALESPEEFAEFAGEIDAPLLANMTEFGKTPYLNAAQFRRLGYKLVIFPVTAFRVMLKALHESYEELMVQGTQKGLIDRMMSREEVYDLIDYYAHDNLAQTFARAVADILDRTNPEQ